MEIPTLLILLALAVLALVIYFWRQFNANITIFEFQKGLLYKKGFFVKILDAGKHQYNKSNTHIHLVDIRKSLLSLPGQEVLTKDNITVKISLVGFYELTDPVKARHQSQDYLMEMYNRAQIILRDLVAKITIDELLEQRGEVDKLLTKEITKQAKELGLTISSFAIKDIMLPANLKRAFSSILEAKKEAQSQLEKARGEQAVLRSLANSSKIYEKNPALLQARLIQELSSGDNSIVFNTEAKKLVVPEKKK